MSERTAPDLTPTLIALMKGVIERELSPVVWQALITHQSRIRDHVAILGLELALDEAEGFAYLRQRREEDPDAELPRLVPRRQLSYPISLLLVLLRKKLAEADATGGETRLVMTGIDILEMVRLFLPDATNQAKFQERIDRDIARIVELGFLRRLNAREDTFEVRRILRSFIDAQWLSDFNERLAAYAAHGQQPGAPASGVAHE